MEHCIKLDVFSDEHMERYYHSKMAINTPLIKTLHQGVTEKEILLVLMIYKRAFRLSKRAALEMFAKVFLMAYNVTTEKHLDLYFISSIEDICNCIESLSDDELEEIKRFLSI